MLKLHVIFCLRFLKNDPFLTTLSAVSLSNLNMPRIPFHTFWALIGANTIQSNRRVVSNCWLFTSCHHTANSVHSTARQLAILSHELLASLRCFVAVRASEAKLFGCTRIVSLFASLRYFVVAESTTQRGVGPRYRLMRQGHAFDMRARIFLTNLMMYPGICRRIWFPLSLKFEKEIIMFTAFICLGMSSF